MPAVWASTETAEASGEKDPGRVVVDEVLGQWITLLGASSYHLRNLVLGFVLFRVFDITKPYPVRQLESLPRGYGIVADDIGAGIYAALILYVGSLLHIW